MRILSMFILILSSSTLMAQTNDMVGQCMGKICVGQEMTSYEIKGAQIGRVTGFTMGHINGETSGQVYPHAIIDLGYKTQNVYLSRLSKYSADKCNSGTSSEGIKYEYCIGDEVNVHGKWAVYTAFDWDLFVTKDGEVLQTDYSDGLVTKKFLNCEQFLGKEICQTSEYQNAKGELENLLGISKSGQFLLKTPVENRLVRLNLEELRNRIAKKTSISKKIKFNHTGFKGEDHKKDALKNAQDYAIYRCAQSFLGYGVVNKSTKIVGKSCSMKFHGPSFNHGPIGPYRTWECGVDIDLQCDDGYTLGLPKADLSKIRSYPLYPTAAVEEK